VTFRFHFEIEKPFSKSPSQTFSSSLESDSLINKRNYIIDHYIHNKSDHTDDEKVYFDDLKMTFPFRFEIGKSFSKSSN
jgi:hypothetical protein